MDGTLYLTAPQVNNQSKRVNPWKLRFRIYMRTCQPVFLI